MKNNLAAILAMALAALVVALGLQSAYAHKATAHKHEHGIVQSNLWRGGDAASRRAAACKQARRWADERHGNQLASGHYLRVDSCSCLQTDSDSPKVRCAVAYSVVQRDSVFGACGPGPCTELF